jgi:hypothetical protein
MGDLSGADRDFRSDEVAAWFEDAAVIREFARRYQSEKGKHDEYNSIPYSDEADKELKVLSSAAAEVNATLRQTAWQQAIARAKDMIGALEDRRKGRAANPPNW